MVFKGAMRHTNGVALGDQSPPDVALAALDFRGL
jgi:hypothetical protein